MEIESDRKLLLVENTSRGWRFVIELPPCSKYIALTVIKMETISCSWVHQVGRPNVLYRLYGYLFPNQLSSGLEAISLVYGEGHRLSTAPQSLYPGFNLAPQKRNLCGLITIQLVIHSSVVYPFVEASKSAPSILTEPRHSHQLGKVIS